MPFNSSAAMNQTLLAVMATLAAQVAQNGTFNIAYPAGYAQADFAEVGQNGHTILLGTAGSSAPYDSGSDFTLVFGPAHITVTWLNALTLASGTVISLNVNQPEIREAATAIAVDRLPLTRFTNADGTALAAAASAGKFGISQTLGTSSALAGEVANATTKTDEAVTEYVLPAAYVAGSPINVTVNAKLVGAAVAGTNTVALAAYKTADDGTQGANIVTQAAVSLGGATVAADVNFQIPGDGLQPGDRLSLALTGVCQATNAANLNMQINSVRVSL